jgi:hypothetical protein
MLLPLPVKIGEVGHGQNRRAAAQWAAEQRDLKPVIIPFRSERPRDLGSLGSLEVLMSRTEANRATSGDLPQTQAHFKLQSKNFFNLAHGQSPGWQADPRFRREAACHCVVQRRYLPVENMPAKPNAVTGSA